MQLTPAQQGELERRLRTVDHDRVRSVTGKHSRQNSSVARCVAGSFTKATSIFDLSPDLSPLISLISVLLLDLDSPKDFSQVFGRFFSSFQFTVEL